MIKITGVDLRQFVMAVYDLSSPQGLGHLQAKVGALDEETVDQILAGHEKRGIEVINMDYVHGRACKMSVWRQGGELWIDNRWFDHSDEALAELLKRVGIEREPQAA